MFFSSHKKYDFADLFIFEMANNHQGSVEHGLRIIREFAEEAKLAGVRAAIKFQFRNLDTFIHPEYRGDKENKHISRFLSTRLSEEQFQTLVNEVRAQGLIVMATPFDEESVDMAQRLGVEIIKIGSCSAKDWPLLEKAGTVRKPMVISTAGLAPDDVDNLVSFFDNRDVDYALMHCVGIYPTPPDLINLERIAFMKNRYPHVEIGFSTHEPPADTEMIKLAYAKGARLFERHVGIETQEIKLNSYSSTPQQIRAWLAAYGDARTMIGTDISQIKLGGKSEQDSLETLMRGVFAKKAIKQGEAIQRADVFFAMPLLPGQITSGRFRGGAIADQDYAPLTPLSAVLAAPGQTGKQILYRVLHQVKGMLREAKIAVNHDSTVELSHHRGLKNLPETGAIMITCINREYCKKIIVVLPGQVHPKHYHNKKEESFQVLAGELHVELDGQPKILFPGDTLLVPRGVAHSFTAPNGAVFEEVSTTHHHDDSHYADKAVSDLKPEQRKTVLVNWGKHQFDDVDEI